MPPTGTRSVSLTLPAVPSASVVTLQPLTTLLSGNLAFAPAVHVVLNCVWGRESSRGGNVSEGPLPQELRNRNSRTLKSNTGVRDQRTYAKPNGLASAATVASFSNIGRPNGTQGSTALCMA